MLEVERGADLAAYIGRALEPGDWIVISQQMIDKFAEATGDHQWIHIDVERANREMPGGKTIAHGYLSVSLLPRMAMTVFKVRQKSRGVNYGSNKVRFTAPVPSGSRIRLRQKILLVEPIEGGVRLTTHNEIEVEGSDRPAAIAETMQLVFD